MRTVRCSGCLGEGGIYLGGVCLGGVYTSLDPEADIHPRADTSLNPEVDPPPPPRAQNHRRKIITFPQLQLRTVITGISLPPQESILIPPSVISSSLRQMALRVCY